MTSPRTAPLSSYRTPGVRLEWLDAAPQARTLVRTDIAGFVGVAERGPLHQAVAVEGWDQFRGVFGEHLPAAYLAYAVEGFYANGGSRCWVVRVADPATAGTATVTLLDAQGGPVLALAATSPGMWGEQVSCRVDNAGGGLFTLTLRLGAVTEVWRNLAPVPNPVVGRDPVALLDDPNAGSRLVTVSWPPNASGHSPVPGPLVLTGGADGLATLTTEHFIGADHPWGLSALDTIDEVALVVQPDLWARPVSVTRRPTTPTPPCGDLSATTGDSPPVVDPTARPPFTPDEVAEVQAAMIAHCERHHDRVTLLDSPQDPLTSPADAVAWRNQFDSSFGALYYPWLLVVDPLSPDADVTAVPPSGHVAGVCARVDTTVGVHKPPANELVELPVDTVSTVDDIAHGDLNDGGVNAIRVQRGIRVLGDRTVTRSDPEWLYLNVRRLVLALEEQILSDTAWTVFEPNGPALQTELDRVIRSLLEQVWRNGMLAGATKDQAFSVRCDASVNPPADLAVGKFTCLIGLNPPPPAEFVVIRVIRTPTGMSVDTESGG
ncbi:phage tail sheath family protein [Kutzneria sp. CA-103260]|uniref:phage tail sheath family protein n=1 Tax=Kutzneria sp. CA-103260 TaxID=2802641 RepID=UPI001BAE2DF6|nr:phage tail sheath subtilisin-like domain-containing protein [Kutzneria sp. CA-103260]QUQ65641.1 tail protein [Kutzneria sp. CA-103260]